MANKQIKIPGRFIVRDVGYKTRYLMDSRTGKLKGRQGRIKRKLPVNVNARMDTSPAATTVKRVKKVKTGKYGDYAGEIFGRYGRIPVRASKKRRGTVRRRI